jgi:hypothetical protein
MTAQTPHLTAPAAPAKRRRRGDGQVAALVAGAVLTVFGLGGLVAGGGVLAVFGNDGTVNSGTHSLSTPTAALVSEPAEVRDTRDVADAIGNPRVRFTVDAETPGKGVFVGVGPADQVDRYLAGAPVDEVSDIEVAPFELDRDRRPGTKRLAAPGAQTFWVAQNEGRDSAGLRWKVRDGDYRVVIMNADGSTGVDTEGEVALTVPDSPEIAWVLIGGGLLLLAGGAAASVAGLRRPKHE